MDTATRVVVAVVEIMGDDTTYAQWLEDFRAANMPGNPDDPDRTGTVLIMERGPFETSEVANAAYNSAHDLARAWANASHDLEQQDPDDTHTIEEPATFAEHDAQHEAIEKTPADQAEKLYGVAHDDELPMLDDLMARAGLRTPEGEML